MWVKQNYWVFIWQKINKLTLLELLPRLEKQSLVWLFKCEACWKEKVCDVYRFAHWRLLSCWCMRCKPHRIPIEQLIGKRNNRLEIIWEWWISTGKVQNKREVLVRCDCGKEYNMEYQNFKWQISCWCRMSETRVIPHIVKHWLAWTRFYNTHHLMNQRCANKNNTAYWWRWIEVCDKWKNIEWFAEDMYESYLQHVEEYWEKQTTIERIDVNKWYNKENCKRATWKEQYANRRPNKVNL